MILQVLREFSQPEGKRDDVTRHARGGGNGQRLSAIAGRTLFLRGDAAAQPEILDRARGGDSVGRQSDLRLMTYRGLAVARRVRLRSLRAGDDDA